MIQTGTYFSTKDDIQEILLNALDEANSKVFVAVAWLTDKTLFGKLKELQGRGVGVEVIIANHESNHNSGINYSELNDAGGEVIIMGDGEGIMHNKFCVIDYNIVCMGSYNWTYSARSRNQEFLNLDIGNARMVDDFVQEFRRLKELAGASIEFSTPDFSETIQILNLIKAFMGLKQPHQIIPYLYQLESVPDVADITAALRAQFYDKALMLINEFISTHTIPVSTRERVKAELIFKIQYYSYHVGMFEAEKVQIEAELDQFSHRYVIELNPHILRILDLKKRIFAKMKKYGFEDKTYEDLEKEFTEAETTLRIEEEIKIQELSDIDLENIKQLYREAVTLCHFDSPNCIFESEEEANSTFDQLTKAYKANDLKQVKLIVSELRMGKKVTQSKIYDELDHLKAKLLSLEQKYHLLLEELFEIKSSEEYKRIPPRELWDQYFEQSKIQLVNEYDELIKKYAKS